MQLALAYGTWTFSDGIDARLGNPTPPLDEAHNTQALGLILYDRYFLLFQLSGLILLVAMVGAIVLTLRHRADIKRQDVLAQMYRDPAKAMELKDVKPGQGLVRLPCRHRSRFHEGSGMAKCLGGRRLFVTENSELGPRAEPWRRIRRGPDRMTRGRAVASRRDDMTIGLEHYLTVAAALFVIGIFGIFLNRKNVIIILMSIELMLLAVNINLVAFSSFLGDLTGQVFTLFILTVAAAEAAIGLAILVCFFRNRGTIAVEDVNVMKG
jgi:NADH-quinone oxidoreductase subunit K